jgi:hypothetical protein
MQHLQLRLGRSCGRQASVQAGKAQARRQGLRRASSSGLSFQLDARPSYFEACVGRCQRAAVGEMVECGAHGGFSVLHTSSINSINLRTE